MTGFAAPSQASQRVPAPDHPASSRQPCGPPLNPSLGPGFLVLGTTSTRTDYERYVRSMYQVSRYPGTPATVTASHCLTILAPPFAVLPSAPPPWPARPALYQWSPQCQWWCIFCFNPPASPQPQLSPAEPLTSVSPSSFLSSSTADANPPHSRIRRSCFFDLPHSSLLRALRRPRPRGNQPFQRLSFVAPPPCAHHTRRPPSFRHGAHHRGARRYGQRLLRRPRRTGASFPDYTLL